MPRSAEAINMSDEVCNPRLQDCTENLKKLRFRRRDCDLDPKRPLYDDIDAEINDREYAVRAPRTGHSHPM
jgi:hypothetical protein